MKTQQHLVTYLAAQRQHDEAERLMAAAEAKLDQLIESGIDENLAWTISGVALCNRRSLNTYAEMRRARDRLRPIA
jgi:hypothetical protein